MFFIIFADRKTMMDDHLRLVLVQFMNFNQVEINPTGSFDKND